MKLNEIKKRLEIGKSKFLCVHAVELSDFPGIRRDVVVGLENSITVEFFEGPEDDLGLRVRYKYSSWKDLSAALAAYLKIGEDEFVLFDELPILSKPSPSTVKNLMINIVSGGVDLPSNWSERISLSSVIDWGQ